MPFWEASLKKLVCALAVVMAPVASWASEPQEGVELKVRRGFFVETDIGGFLTVGGDNDYSNMQTYLQLGVGYDVSEKLELGVHFGLGSNAANCWSGLRTNGIDCIETDNFTVTFLDASAAYLLELAPRFYLAPKVLVGYTRLDPAPIYSPATGPDGKRKEGAVPLSDALNVGGGLGVEYATSMDHFTIGVDVLYRFIVGPNMHSLQLLPRIKYTF